MWDGHAGDGRAAFREVPGGRDRAAAGPAEGGPASSQLLAQGCSWLLLRGSLFIELQFDRVFYSRQNALFVILRFGWFGLLCFVLSCAGLIG